MKLCTGKIKGDETMRVNELTEIIKRTRTPLANRVMLRPNDDAERITTLWDLNMQRFGQKLDGVDVGFAYQTFYTWTQPAVIDRPVIVGAQPGFGKSTMLKTYLRYMVRQHPETFGAIVVKERIDDIDKLADHINRDNTDEPDLLRQKSYAYSIRGYDPNSMTREHYEDQFTTQAKFNVVLMTTKQFELQTLKDNLRNFVEYVDENGRKHPRRLLLIDEKPSLVVSQKLSTRGLNDLVDDIREASFNARGSMQPYYRKTLQIVNELRQSMEDPSIKKLNKLQPLKPGYKLPVRLLSDFGNLHNIDRISALRSFERVVSAGGEISEYNGQISVVTTFCLHYEFTLFNTFILDGTGRRDPDYTANDFYIMEPKELPDYSNVTFSICGDYSLSRTSLRAKLDALSNIATMCKRIAEQNVGQTLIVTYREYVEQLSEMLAKEVDSGSIRMKHFDGGRGSNEFTGADNAIYIGSLFKGTSYYATAAQAVIGDRLGKELSNEFKVTKQGITFDDPLVEEYKKLDVAVNMVQETNRLRAGQKANKVNIYIFNKDEEIIRHITDDYPGAKVEKYTPLERISGSQTSADLIIGFFSNMGIGEEVKQSAIYKTLGIHRNTFTKEFKTDRVQQSMKEYGIEKVKTRYIKRPQ